MVGKLIMLPLRVGVKSARLITHLAGEGAGRALSLAGQVIGAASPDRSVEPSSPPAPSTDTPVEPEPAQVAAEESQPVAEQPAAPVAEQPAAPVAEQPAAPVAEQPAAPVAEEPAHVSEEPELVREEAERGAEDGAGADVTVLEPWPGYARMNARDVIERAQQADPAELAAVRLYEARHQSRQTVLDEVDRQLKLGNGGAPA